MFVVLSDFSLRNTLSCCFALFFVSLLCIPQAHAFQGKGQTQFSIGDRVQFQRMGKTITGTVVELTGPGWPRVEYKQNDNMKQTVLPPAHLKIAVEVVDEENPIAEPTQDKNKKTVDSEQREWKSSKGTFSVLAKLVSQDENNVKLETETGKIVDVPIKKLSENDQTFLANLNADDDNPFGAEGVSVDPSEVAKAALLAQEEARAKEDQAAFQTLVARTAQAKMITPAERSKAIELIDVQWTFEPVGPRAPAISAGGVASVEYPVKKSFWTKYTPLVLSHNENYAAWTVSNSYEEYKFITVVDTVNRKTTQTCRLPMTLQKDADLRVIAVSDDGQRLATGQFKSSTCQRIDFWKFDDGQLIHQKYWGGKGGGLSETNHAYFIGEHQFLTIGRTVTLWDMQENANLYTARSDALIFQNRLPLSPDGKTLLLFREGKLFFTNIDSGTIVGQIEFGGNFHAGVSFSPDGSKLATSHDGEIRIWDMATGKVLKSFYTTARGTGAWLQDDLLLIGKVVIDLRLQAVVWKYNIFDFVSLVQYSNGMLAFKGQKRFVSARLPYKDVVAANAAMNPDDLNIFNPGDKIGIEIKLPFSSAVKKQIEDHLKKTLEGTGTTFVSSNANLVFKFSLTAPKPVEANVTRFGGRWSRNEPKETVKYNEQQGLIELYRGKEKIWGASRYFTAPQGAVQLKDGESFQQYVNRVSKVTPDFFTSFEVPKGINVLPADKIGSGRFPSY